MNNIKKIGIYTRRDGHTRLVRWMNKGNWRECVRDVLSLKAWPRPVKFPPECAAQFAWAV